MATVFIYRTLEGNPRGNCPVCKAWNGRESRNRADLPPTPNPACLSGQVRCHCFIETREEQGSGGGGGDGGGSGGGGDGGGEGGGGGGGFGGGGGGGAGGGEGSGSGGGGVSITWYPYSDWWWEEV